MLKIWRADVYEVGICISGHRRIVQLWAKKEKKVVIQEINRISEVS